MGDTQGGVDLPPNVTEAQLMNIIRELLGDDEMGDADLMSAYRSGMFQELCPDIANYASQLHSKSQKDSAVAGPSAEVKQEKKDKSSSLPRAEEGKSVEKKASTPFVVHIFPKIKPELNLSAEAEADSDDSTKHSSNHHHHKKKKKKHKHHKDGKREKSEKERDGHHHRDKSEKERDRDHKEKLERDKGQHKEKSSGKDRDHHHKQKSHSVSHEKSIVKTETIQLTSDSEEEIIKPVEKPKMEKKTKIIMISSSSDEHEEQRTSHKNNKVEDAKLDPNVKVKTEKLGDSTSKHHKINHDKSDGDSNANFPRREVKRERTPEKRKEKTFTKYRSSASHIVINRWKPVFDRDHFHYQKKFRLKPVSVVCLDLLDLPILFHDPKKRSKNPNSVPLQSNLSLDQSRIDTIRRLERDKLGWFKRKLRKQALRSLKRHKNSSDEENERKHKRVRIMASSSSSDISSNGGGIPAKKAKIIGSSSRDKKNVKLSKAQIEAEEKRKRLEEIKRKAERMMEKTNTKGTRVLPWENKGEYFKSDKKNADALSKEKKLDAERRKRMEKERQKRLDQQKHVPSVSFQRILAQIDAANKEEAKKPKVELKIPKLSQKQKDPVSGQYKLEGRTISVGEVATEVGRLLASDTKVEAPVVPDNSEELGEYTVKKIAWWILKNEKDPPPERIFHPELHDNSDNESVRSDDFHWDSDLSSIHGCVSDPEGTSLDIRPSRDQINDPDWADEYCGEASLYAKMRRDFHDVSRLESPEGFRGFLRIKPGTNYAKTNFETKCFICNEVIRGQRKLGAHIRSDSHKNSFRNYSLAIADYEEITRKPVYKKEFIAKLVAYASNSNQGCQSGTSDKSLADEQKHHMGKLDHVRSDSPGPIVAGDAAANVETAMMPIPDDISLPSIEDYDISSDDSLMQVKVAIRTCGKWDQDLEARWRSWLDEEAKIAEMYNEEREFFINEPNRHPKYQEEWLKFWDRRCLELEAEGVNVDTYNFEKEWMGVWLKRMQEIMKEEVELKVKNLKMRLQIDKHILRHKYQIDPEKTRRTKKKNKVGKMGQDNSSSHKSSSKGPISDSVHHNYNVNNATFQPGPMHAKVQQQQQHNHGHHRPHPGPGPKQKKHNRNKQHKRERHPEKNNFNRHPNAARDRNHSSDSWRRDEPRNFRQQSPKRFNTNNSNKFSAEPPPPGESPFYPRNRTDYSNPVSSKPDFKDKREQFKNELNRMSKGTSESNQSRINDNDASRQKDRDSDNDSLTSVNARELQSSLRALREAMAQEEGVDSKQDASQLTRPKIKPIAENTEKQKKLEDGEVASDVSSLDFQPDFQHVSSYINKEIPEEKSPAPAIAADNLDKNSLGYHLLERRKSTEQFNKHSSKIKTAEQQPDSKQKQGSSHDQGLKNEDWKKGKHDNKSKDDRNRNSNKHHKNKNKPSWARRNSKDDHHQQHRQNKNFHPRHNSSGAYTPQNESWEPEHPATSNSSWGASAANNNPPYPSVPETGNHIPVVSARRETQSFNHNNQPYYQNSWGNQQQQQNWGNYPPQMNDPNNYYR